MNRCLIAVIMGTAISGIAPSKGQEVSVADDRVRRLLSEKREVRAEARRELVYERRNMIAQLVSVIEEKADRTSNYGLVEDAMSVLGDLRASEAVDTLVSHIGYPRTAKTDDRRHSAARLSLGDAGFPAIDPLVRIGEPCVDAVIMKIRTTTSTDERIACVGVLKRLGVPFVRERLEKAATISNERERDSVREALGLFDEWISPQERVEKHRRRLEEFFEKNPLRR